MQLSITQQLVAAFLGLTAVVLAATLLLARWSFEQGFLDYVNALEQTRLQQLAQHPELLDSTAAAEEGQNRPAAELISSRFLRQLDISANYQRRDKTPSHTAQLRHTGPPGLSGPPPHLSNRSAPAQGAEQRAAQHLVSGDRPRGPGRPPLYADGHRNPLAALEPRHRPGAGQPLMPPTSLYDPLGNHLAGPVLTNDASTIVVDVMSAGSKIAELRSAPRRVLQSSQETAFARQQLQASLIIAAVALSIAVALSVVLARALLAPVQRLRRTVSALAQGDFRVTLDPVRADELGQLMANVNQLARILDQSQQARKRWLADISHELRTPVTILRGELESIQSGLRKLDATQLTSFSEEVERINKLIEDLYQLALSDLGALRYQFTKLDLQDCLQEVVVTLKSQEQLQAQPTQILLQGCAAEIHGDQDRLHQLFMNLLRNSLFYTTRPGKIVVQMSADNSHVQISIEDSAPGVDVATCEQLFEPMYRADSSRNSRTGGAGLGLAICRNIVTAHNGHISAQPSALGGVRIDIQLPISDGPERRK